MRFFIFIFIFFLSFSFIYSEKESYDIFKDGRPDQRKWGRFARGVKDKKVTPEALVLVPDTLFRYRVFYHFVMPHVRHNIAIASELYGTGEVDWLLSSQLRLGVGGGYWRGLIRREELGVSSGEKVSFLAFHASGTYLFQPLHYAHFNPYIGFSLTAIRGRGAQGNSMGGHLI